MNAAIRAAALVARSQGADVVGIERGYRGLVDDAVVALTQGDVAGILREGGTILGSARRGARSSTTARSATGRAPCSPTAASTG